MGLLGVRGRRRVWREDGGELEMMGAWRGLVMW